MKKLIRNTVLATCLVLTGTLGIQAQSYSGTLTHTNGYFSIKPYGANYDDGSYAKTFYDGNNSRIRFWNSKSTVTYTDLELGSLFAMDNLGVGNGSPGARLHVKEATALGSLAGDYQIITKLQGITNNNFYLNNWLVRDEDGSGWLSARFHNAISIDGSFVTPQVDTKTWWERDPYHNIQSWGNGDNTYFTINNGKVGVGTTSPNYEFVVNGGNGINQFVLGNSGNGQNIETLQGNILLMRNLNTGAYNAGSSLAFGTGENSETVWAAVEGLYTGWTSGNHGGDLRFLTKTNNTSGLSERMRITKTGFIGIGTSTPSSELEVDGTITSEEVKVEVVGAPDYVFAPTYQLRSLKETEEYIQANSHLPEIPSAKEMEANGVELGEMNMLLLKKIEELTLYQIEQNKKYETLTLQLIDQQKEISTMKVVNQNQQQVIEELAKNRLK